MEPSNFTSSLSRKQHRKKRMRRGVVTMEFALVIPMYIVIVSVAVVGGIRIFQRQQVTEMAKYLARQAIVHGSAAEDVGAWGPQTIVGSFGDGSPIGTLMAEKYSQGDSAALHFRLVWPDGGNDASRGDRVEVTVSTSELMESIGIEPVIGETLEEGWAVISGWATLMIMH
jgi:hypothetical protein